MLNTEVHFGFGIQNLRLPKLGQKMCINTALQKNKGTNARRLLLLEGGGKTVQEVNLLHERTSARLAMEMHLSLTRVYEIEEENRQYLRMVLYTSLSAGESPIFHSSSNRIEMRGGVSFIRISK